MSDGEEGKREKGEGKNESLPPLPFYPIPLLLILITHHLFS